MLLTRRQDSLNNSDSTSKSNDDSASPTLSTSRFENRMSLRVYGNSPTSLSGAIPVTPQLSLPPKDGRSSSPVNPDLGYHTLVSATSPTPCASDQWQREISSPTSWNEMVVRPPHHTHHHHHHHHQQQQQQQQPGMGNLRCQPCQQQQQQLQQRGVMNPFLLRSPARSVNISSSSSDASSSRLKASSSSSSSSPKCSPFDSMPDVVILRVFSYLSTNELCACSRVCRRFYFLTWEPRLWTNVELCGERTDVDRALRSVVQLLCRGSPVTTATVGVDCPTIERVVLSGCVRLTDRGLITVARHCSQLRCLQLKGCQRITNGGILEVVSACANLDHLDLTGCTQIDCIDVSRLQPRQLSSSASSSSQQAQCLETRLRYLDLTDCQAFSDHALKATLRGCQQLTHLYLRRCAGVSDAGLRHVAAHCPFLKELSVSDCPQVTDFGLYELARRLGPSLRYLSVAKCDQVSDAGVKQLARHCYRLRYVNVRGCEAVSDDGAAALARSCPRLRALDLGKCDVTDVGLRHLAENCPNLRRVSLKSCELVTDKGVRWLAVYCRGLQQLNVQDCRLVSVNGYRTIKRHCRRCIIEHTNPGFC